MRTFTMYDAVNVAALPGDTQITVGYVDGRDTSGHYAEVKRRFPHALVIPTTVTGEHLDAKIGDVEAGDMTPESAARWALEKVKAGQAPTLYCSAASWPEVRRAVAALRFPPGGPPLSWFIADYDNVAKIPRGAVGKQYRTGRYDTSIIAADWPGVLPTPMSPWQRRRARRLVAGLSTRYTPLPASDHVLLQRIERQRQRIDTL